MPTWEAPMQLSPEQVAAFERDGYLFIENLFSAGEVGVMRAEALRLYAQERPEIQREKDGKTVRTVFAAQHFSEVYDNVARHPRLVGPAMQLLGGPVYIHQFKLNAKAAFDGDVWQWHQDYGTWSRDDEMPEARAMNLAVFLDEVNEFNGPLYLIPGSHREGVIEAGHDVSTTSYPLWTLDNATIRRLVEQGGIVAPKGPAGAGLMFHGCLVHGSPPNMTPWGRTIVYISANRCDNAIRRFKRPEYIAHRDFTPIVPAANDCLLRLAAA
jgi:ectoine hydroxylase